MSRRVPIALLVASATLGLTIPAWGHTDAAQRNRTLVVRMGGHIGRVIGHHTAVIAAPPRGATITYQGFRCQVTIGEGTSDTIYNNHFVFDSTEFYNVYRARGRRFYSVTTNCIGALPPGTNVATKIVSAPTANCGQIDPFDATKFISGHGITTTFPDGMFSETCNTPRLRSR